MKKTTRLTKKAIVDIETSVTRKWIESVGEAGSLEALARGSLLGQVHKESLYTGREA